ncbi:MAG: class I SAM-dependent methyltransferase [Candidatus Bathyarchaeia archaeon]
MSYPVKKVFFGDHVFNIWSEVYEPAEDSFFFAENITVKDGERVLDMGTGCGILGIIAAEKASKVLTVDINPHAVHCAKENAKLNGVAEKMFFVQGDLFTAIRTEEKFDLILFNAPYLPSEPYEGTTWLGRAWAGGTNGRAIIDRFAHEVPKHLEKGDRVLLLQSTLANVNKTLKILEAEGLKTRIAAKLDLPLFETIVLIEAKP